ncbi:MAG: tRNA (N6-isopentenyl adenosine(37)-C2)-methylthiotransferase MiaB [Christensenellaceae bacterium]|nr:tRNA (N6-isopentenyl adenosine(37)-C2)-methylthiotransferase MiaB [Christensenellaceae bacterium]
MNKYFIHTFGCQMNVHESEKIAGTLVSLGYVATDDINFADVIVFNTCCIRDSAEKKIYAKIGDVKGLKRLNELLIVCVVGCMTQQTGMSDTLKSKFPFIDIVLGTSNVHLLGEKIKEISSFYLKNRKKIYEITDSSTEIVNDFYELRTSYPNAWVNIMYGCNNYCTYCIVPFVRGRERSRSPQSILDEVKRLLDEGYKEITLLGQNVNSYFSDNWNFAKLLDAIGALSFKFRLRFMTSHPKDFSSEIVDIMTAHKSICNFIHLPVQAGSNNVLKAMGRQYTREKYLDLISMIRNKIPDCGITSDIMVGFPTESDEDFFETLELVKAVRFTNAFTFVYSPRTGTVAQKMLQIPANIKKERITKLIELQNQISQEKSYEYLNKTYEILVEGVKDNDLACGKTSNGRLVNFKCGESKIGDFLNIHVDKVKASALWGHIENGRE